MRVCTRQFLETLNLFTFKYYFHIPKQMKRTAEESQFVMQTLLVQLTLETRNVTFVLVTMVSKAMDLCATVWEQFQLITVKNLGLSSIQLKFVLYDVETK